MALAASALQALAAAASLEMSAREAGVVETARGYLRAGTRVTVTWLPKDTPRDRIAAAVVLRNAGLEPEPHLAARFIRSEAELKTLVAALVQEAGVTGVFVIAGDTDQPQGPYADAQALLDSGVLQAAGVTRVGVAAYPEGHPGIPADRLADALAGKVRWAACAGVGLRLVTQLCFEAAPILRFVENLRAQGVAVPVSLGVPGPASLASLAHFAVRCGVGASARALARRPGTLGKLALQASPDALVRELMPAADTLGDIGLHVFAFGGLARTARWLGALASA